MTNCSAMSIPAKIDSQYFEPDDFSDAKQFSWSAIDHVPENGAWFGSGAFVPMAAAEITASSHGERGRTYLIPVPPSIKPPPAPSIYPQPSPPSAAEALINDWRDGSPPLNHHRRPFVSTRDEISLIESIQGDQSGAAEARRCGRLGDAGTAGPPVIAEATGQIKTIKGGLSKPLAIVSSWQFITRKKKYLNIEKVDARTQTLLPEKSPMRDIKSSIPTDNVAISLLLSKHFLVRSHL